MWRIFASSGLECAFPPTGIILSSANIDFSFAV
jgi:hypothetical protein